jgi:hypothetical protein
MGVTVFTDDGNGQTVSSVLLDNGDIKLKLGKKYYLDNDLDTYLTCAADDVVDVYIGGSKDFSFSTNKLTIETASYIQAAGATGVYIAPFYPTASPAALSGAGAISFISYYTPWSTTGADAATLGDGEAIGQMKKIQMILDGGDGTLTPTTLANGTTITFADIGDYAILQWSATGWVELELGNQIDGRTGPVMA